MDGTLHVDEFVIGGVEKGKVGRSYDAKKKKALIAVQLTKDGKEGRMYPMRMEDFSSRSLQYIFVNNISRSAKWSPIYGRDTGRHPRNMTSPRLKATKD